MNKKMIFILALVFLVACTPQVQKIDQTVPSPKPGTIECNTDAECVKISGNLEAKCLQPLCECPPFEECYCPKLCEWTVQPAEPEVVEEAQ